MASGIKINDECSKYFKELKSQKYRYILYRLSDDSTQIIWDKKHPMTKEDSQEVDTVNANMAADYALFLADLQAVEVKKECRYAVYFAKYYKNNIIREKILFIMWCPSGAKGKQKMTYSTTEDTLKKALDTSALNLSMMADEIGDLSWESDVLPKLLSKDNV